jgi:quercetin dioxygenase-like cupin family protein
MNENEINNGVLCIHGETLNIEEFTWNEHQAFKGVFLKHLITGETTDNQLSCHLVKINPDCTIGNHIHTGKTELHEIVSGSGQCFIEQTKYEYKKGVVGYIPADKNHSVIAGSEGLFLLAKFFPALL